MAKGDEKTQKQSNENKEVSGNRAHSVLFKASGLREEGGGTWKHSEELSLRCSAGISDQRQHQTMASNAGIQGTWQFLRLLTPSLYFYPRGRKSLCSPRPLGQSWKAKLSLMVNQEDTKEILFVLCHPFFFFFFFFLLRPSLTLRSNTSKQSKSLRFPNVDPFLGCDMLQIN